MSIDIDHFRVELLKERERVQAAITHLRDDHPGSLDEEVEEVSPSSYTLGENSAQVLSEIDAALQRIEDGTYGTCAVCGKEIAPERLEAHPWASLCIDDARKAERA